jgi:hypothetical protein
MALMDNVPRDKLRDLIVRDRSLCEDPSRCEGLLRDHCGSYKGEISALISALRAGAATDLLNKPSNVPANMVSARLTSRLEDDCAMSGDAARWAVESWAYALGLNWPRIQARSTSAAAKSAGSAREKKNQPRKQLEKPRRGPAIQTSVAASARLAQDDRARSGPAVQTGVPRLSPDPAPTLAVPSGSAWSGKTWLILVAVAFAALVAFLRLASHPDAPGTRPQLVTHPEPAQPAGPNCDPYGLRSTPLPDTCPKPTYNTTPPAPQLGSNSGSH